MLAFDYCKGYDCATARNKIAQEAIDGGFDYVLMVDSDIILPQDTIDFLIQDAPDICVGVYPRKNTNCGQTELFKFSEKDYLDRFTFDDLSQYADYDRIMVKGSGMGCALIKTEVFSRLPYPWFRYVQYNNGDVLSEDLFFCDVARKNGLNILADMRVKCGHLVRRFIYQ